MEKNLEKSITKQKKYSSFEILKESTSTIIYKGVQLNSKKKIVLKMEKLFQKKSPLKNEFEIYCHLHRDPLASIKGIPQIVAYERYGLVMEKLGPSVSDLYESSPNKFSLKFVVGLALQMINILKYLHSRGIVHRDVKPSNFLFGEKNGKADYKRLYLSDYGFSNFFLLKDGEHIPFREGAGFFGTPRFAGKWSLAGLEQSRREDLESFFYSVIYLLKGRLPWDEEFNKNLTNYEKALIKIDTKKKALIRELPKEFERMFDYVNQLTFIKEPDYEFLKNLFKKML